MWFRNKDSLKFENIFPAIRRRTVQLNDFIILPIAKIIAGLVYTSATAGAIASVASVIKVVLVAAIAIGGSLWSQSKAKGKSARALGSGGQQFNTRVPSEPVKLIYGQPRIGVNWIFSEATGGENEDLHAVMTWGEGEVEGIPKTVDVNHIEHTPQGYGCGAGARDLSVQGTYVGTENLYRIEIDNGKIIDYAAQDDGGAVTDETTAAKNATANDMNLFPASPVLNDAYMFGIRASKIPDRLIINVGTAGVGTWTLTWEGWGYGIVGYDWNPETGASDPIYGNTWFALSGVSDGTNGFHNSGSNTVSFTLPTWLTAATVGAKNIYYIRARISSFTSCSTPPKGTQAWLSSGANETFKWSDGGAWSGAVTITGGWQSLSNGVEIKFAATEGHGPKDLFKVMAGDAIWIGERLIMFYNAWDPWGLAWLLGVRDVVTHYFHSGTSAQTVDTVLQSYFPSWQYALRYTAYSYFIFNQLKFWIHKQLPPAEPYQAVPEVTALMKGRKLYDTRTSTTAYSRNPALVWYDLMTNDRYGLGISASLIDTTSVNSAANWCDSNSFYFDGAIRDRDNILDVIDDVLVCFRAFYIWSDGKYRLKIFADDASVLSLTEADVEIGDDSFRVTAPGLPETPSTVKCIFFDKERNYTENFATWGKEDEGQAINPGDETFSEIPLIGIVDYDTAKKLAKYYYRRSVVNNEFHLLCHTRCECLEPGDMVSITHEYPGWSSKKVRVKNIGLPQNGLIPVTFVDENSNIYDQSLNLATRTVPVWYLTGYVVSPPVGLLAETGADENTVNVTDAYIELSCNHLGDGIDYVFYVRKNGATEVESHYVKGPADVSIRPSLRIGGLTVNTLYDWWMTGVHASSGIVSIETDVKTVTTWYPSGPSMADVSLTLISEGRLLLLIWSKSNPNPAIAKWKIYRNTTNDSGTAVLIDEKSAPTRSYRDSSVIIGETYYYWLKAETKSGEVSNAFSAVASLTHRHTQKPFQFDSIDAGSFDNIDGSIGYIGTIQELQMCDSLTGLANDSSPDSVEEYLETSDKMEGTGSLRLVFRRYPKVISTGTLEGNFDGTLGNISARKYLTQRIKTVGAISLKAVGLKILKIGTPGDANLKIYSDSGGTYGGPNAELGSTTITAASTPTSYGANGQVGDFTYFAFSSPIALSAATFYWIVLEKTTADSSNYYKIRANVEVGGAYEGEECHLLMGPTLFSCDAAYHNAFKAYDILFCVCVAGDMLNKHVYYTIGAQDISTKTYIKQWLKCSRSGSGFLSASFGEAAIGEQLSALTINEANVWEWKAWNISAIGASSRNAVTKIGFKVTDMSQDWELKVDYIIANSGEPRPAMRIGSDVKYFLMENLGKSGGQTLIGGLDAGDDLILKSTSHATKGYVYFGSNTIYDEVNDKLGIGCTPASKLDVNGTIRALSAAAPATGSGLEIGNSSGICYLLGYDRGGSAYLPIYFTGSLLKFQVSGSEYGKFGALVSGQPGFIVGAADSYTSSTYIWNNTINEGYDSTADDATLWLNYLGYQGGTTKFRDTIIADGKNAPLFFVDGSAGTVTVKRNLIIGEGGAGIDYQITFDGETNDGLLKWMEDEDYFQFDDDIFLNDGENLVFGTTTGSKIGTATSQKLAFFNSSPIVQPSATGETSGFTAGSGTAVKDDSTFTGNVGSKAYRISDIVKHLKNLGLIASS